MIVISGALCLVALILLIVGLVASSGLTLIYASIGVSLISFVFLFLGVRQRRPAFSAAGAGSPPATPAAPPAPPRTQARAPVGSVGDPAEAGEPGERGGAAAAQPEPARPEAGQPAPSRAEPARAEPAQPPAPGPPEAAAPVPPASVPPAPAPSASAAQPPAGTGQVYVVAGRPRYHAAGCRFLADRQAEQLSVEAAREAGYQPCAVCRVDARVAGGPGSPRTAALTSTPRRETSARTGPTPASRPARAGTEPTKPAAADAARPVLVIPDRGRYHRPECRYVRGASEVSELTAADALRQGYQPCGVCRP